MLDDPGVRAGMRWEEGQSRDAALWVEAALQRERSPCRMWYAFGVVPDTPQVLTGVVIVEVHDFTWVTQAELSAFFAAEHRRRGYAQRALARLLDWCFDELVVTLPSGQGVPIGEVAAICVPENTASQSVLQHLLTYYGRKDVPSRTSGTTVNVLTFCLSRADYVRRRDGTQE